MTVVQSIKKILEINNESMTATEIYEEIVRLNLYNFIAKQPASIVNSALRRHISTSKFQNSVL